jgi:hypothetical protein
MRTILLLACLLLAAGNLASEPIKHPVTGEQGFFVSEADMRATLVLLQERDLYQASYEKAMLEQESLQIQCSCKAKLHYAVMLAEGVLVLITTTLWLLK